MPVTLAAYLSMVLQLLPDGAAAGAQRRWGYTPQRLAERMVPAIVADLPPDVTDTAHVWLAFGQQAR
jgi:hypothetical protein